MISRLRPPRRLWTPLLGTGGIVIVVLLFSPDTAQGCAACFGRSDSKMAQGMNMGIFALLAVIFCVLSALAAFMVFLVRRAAALARENPETTTSAPLPVESPQA